MCVGLVISALRVALMLKLDLAGLDMSRWWTVLANGGADVATGALLATGALELAGRSGPGVRTGWRIAAYGWGAGCVLTLAWFACTTIPVWSSAHLDAAWFEGRGIKVLRYASRAADAAPFVGLAIAAWRRDHRGVAIGGLVAGLVMLVQAWWWMPVFTWLGLGYSNALVFSATIELVSIGATVMVALAATSPADESRPEPDRAARGLRRAARALGLRVLALMLGAAGAVALSHRHGYEPDLVVKLALFGSATLHTAGATWFAVGVLDAARAAVVGRSTLAIAGALALWCAGVMIAQLMCLYATLRDPAMRLWDRAVALGVPLQLIEAVSILLLVQVVIAVAERRALPGLRNDAFGRKIGIGFLLVVSAAIHIWVSPLALDGSSSLAGIFVASACSLGAFGLTSRLSSDAADALDAEQALPHARIVEPG